MDLWAAEREPVGVTDASSPADPDPGSAEVSLPQKKLSKAARAEPEVRLGVPEVAEAFGKSKSWVYKKSSRAAGPKGLPCIESLTASSNYSQLMG